MVKNNTLRFRDEISRLCAENLATGDAAVSINELLDPEMFRLTP